MPLIAVGFAVLMIAAVPRPIQAQQTPEEATHCQALARVIFGDLRGQKMMLDSYRTSHPLPNATEQAHIDRSSAKYDEEMKLFEALRARYANATPPTAEAMAKLRSGTSYNEIKRQAQACL